MAAWIDWSEQDETLRGMQGEPRKKQTLFQALPCFLLTLLILLAVTAQAMEIADIRAAAEAGNAVAMSKMGAFYHYGRGVPQDDSESLRWYLLAARHGHVGAQCIVGMFYLLGVGTVQDGAQGEEWLRRAAIQGDATAKLQLELLQLSPTGK